MTFQEHLRQCQQCREQPFAMCFDGIQLLKAEVSRLTPAQLREAGECAERGKSLALELLGVIGSQRAPAVIVHALAYLLSAVIRDHDGDMTEHEMQGFGLIGDHERIASFCLEVRELLIFMRADTQPSSDRRV